MLEELNKTSQGSAERQLHTLLYRMITQGEVNKPDIMVRVTAIIEGKFTYFFWHRINFPNSFFYQNDWTIPDLLIPESTIAMALRYIPPLTFLP